MEIRIGNTSISKFSKCDVTLKYDSVASVFTFDVYFDPNNQDHKRIFKPCTYQPCTIYHNNELLITGVLLVHSFSSTATPSLITVSGYSRPGILQKTCVQPNYTTKGGKAGIGLENDPKGFTVVKEYQTQFTGMSLYDIASKLCLPFQIGITVDSTVTKECIDDIYPTQDIKPDETIASFLIKLAGQKHVVLSHDRFGNLLFTKTKTVKPVTTTKSKLVTPVPIGKVGVSGAPETPKIADNTIMKSYTSVYDFKPGGAKWYDMKLNIDGEKLHNILQVVGQVSNSEGTTVNLNELNESIVNPYCNDGSVKRFIQSSDNGTGLDTKKTARDLLADDLKAITLNIDMEGWQLGDKLARPNQLITATNPDDFLYNPTRFFIEEVRLSKDAEKETCKLKCVLPECYNDEEVKNVFA